jgi:hypothetical protein
MKHCQDKTYIRMQCDNRTVSAINEYQRGRNWKNVKYLPKHMGQHWFFTRTGRLQIMFGQWCMKQLTWPLTHTQLRQLSSIHVVPCGWCAPHDLACWEPETAVDSGHTAQHCPGWETGFGQGVGRQWCVSHSTRPMWQRHCVQLLRGHVSPSTRYIPSTDWQTIGCCSWCPTSVQEKYENKV